MQSLIISLDHRDIVIQYYFDISVGHTYGAVLPNMQGVTILVGCFV